MYVCVCTYEFESEDIYTPLNISLCIYVCELMCACVGPVCAFVSVFKCLRVCCVFMCLCVCCVGVSVGVYACLRERECVRVCMCA